MTDKSLTNSFYEELERAFPVEFDNRSRPTPSTPQDGRANDTATSVGTTPDLLNTAFVGENETDRPRNESISVSSQPLSQNTQTAASIINCLLDTISDHEGEPLHLRLPPDTTATMPSSSVALPVTPTTTSPAAMPKRPVMISTGTMPRTPDMVSTGTMPKTPSTKSIGIMPRTPTMASTGTMPKTPLTIDLVSPTNEAVDLRSPCTPPSPPPPPNASPSL